MILCKRPFDYVLLLKDPSLPNKCLCTTTQFANTPAQQWNATARRLINCIWHLFPYWHHNLHRFPSVVHTWHVQSPWRSRCSTLYKSFLYPRHAPCKVCLLLADCQRRKQDDTEGFFFVCFSVKRVTSWPIPCFSLGSASLTVLGHDDSRATQRLRLSSAPQSKPALFIFELARGRWQSFSWRVQKEMFTKVSLPQEASKTQL